MFLDHLRHFVHMGGYALFVWSSYGMGALVLFGNIAWSRYQRTKVMRFVKETVQRKRP